MKGPVIGGLVAEEEIELFEIVLNQRKGLQADGAVHEPVVAGHIGNQEVLGGAFGLVFGAQGFLEGVKIGGIFRGEEEDACGEAVFGCVLAADGLAGFRAGAGGVMDGLRYGCHTANT